MKQEGMIPCWLYINKKEKETYNLEGTSQETKKEKKEIKKITIYALTIPTLVVSTPLLREG